MSKRREIEPNGLAVGLVVADEGLAARVSGSLEAAGLSVAFEAVPGDDLPPVDLVMVIGNGKAPGNVLFKRIRERLPKSRLVACLSADETSSVQWVLDSGLDGLVWESQVAETLVATLHAVHAGMLVLPRELPKRAQTPEFTNREKQVLGLMIMGLTNREIADKLFVSENTVKSHLNTAYRKLGVHSRTEAVRLIADPEVGLGTGILAITGPGLKGSGQRDPAHKRRSRDRSPGSHR
jgi:DNA-binding NarL/FixJ family response regulator